MSTKLQEYQARLNESTERLWKDSNEYMSLLRTSSRLYKYSFKDQVLIHSQRPDAVACAEYDTWGREDITNRYVKRGSKGIALIADDNGKARLRYVFDFSDTAARDERSKTPFFWSVTPENENAVLKQLGTNAITLDTAILEKAREIARNYSGDYLHDLMRETDGTFLDELDEFNVQSKFESLLETSIAYTVLTRCGYEAEMYIEPDDFRGIHEFNSVEAISILGNATSDLSEQILRNIELTLKTERSKENDRSITENNDRERNPVHSGREDADLSSRLGTSAAEGNREIRTDEKDFPDEQQERNLSGNAPEGNSEQPFDRDRRNSEPQALGNSPENGERSGSDRGTESDRPDGLGGNDEQSESSGRGNNNQRTDLQLNENEAVSEMNSDTAFSMSEEKVLAIINHYDEMNVSKQETLDFFLENEDGTRRADFIKAAYGHRAVEFELDGEIVGYRKHGDGLEMWEGSPENSTMFSWDVVQELTASLIDRHEFIDLPDFFDIEPEIEEMGGYDEPIQLSLFGDFDDEPMLPTESSEFDYSPASVFTQDMIDYVLRAGSNEPHSLERIVAQFEKNKGVESNAEFLRKEFGTDGRGFLYESPDGLDKARFSAWYDKDGITIGMGETAFNRFGSVSMTWEQVSERISELLNEGRFATQDILKAAEPYDRKQLADKLWYLHQDVEVEYFIPDYFFIGGFDVSTDKIAEALQGEKPVQEMIDGMKDLIKQYEADRDVLRFHFHDLPEILEKLKDRQLDRTKFTAEPSFTVKHKYFITEDEKNRLVASGSNVVGGKKRIAKFFKEPHTAKEKADFLKNEYGIGGSGRSGYNTWHDSKGLVLTKGDLSRPDAQVTMKWNEVAERVSKLVAQNRFITQKDIDDEIRYAKRVIANASDNPLEEQSIKQAKAVLEEYGIELEEKSEPVPELAEETVSDVMEEIEEYNDDEIKLKVGDKIELDDGVFEITEISDSIDDTKYQLRDLGSIYPIFRVMYETEIYENGFALVDEAPEKESVINEPAPNISEVPELNGEKHDFTITDENLGVGGAKSKFKANVEAIPFMEQLTGKSEEQLINDLKGVIFRNPQNNHWETADEYLSGNVRGKLEFAKKSAEVFDEDLSVNIAALEKAMPKPLEASEIDVRLGATWLNTDIIKQFMIETLQVPRYLQNMFDVNFSKYTSEWNIEGKNVDRSNVAANMTYGTARKNAYSIIEDTLNLRDARVYDRVEQPDGTIKSVLNKKETMIAQEKQEAIKQAFKDWIFKDPDRREKLVNKYNEMFNSSRPREYDGSHITFSGMSPEIQLRTHQLNAIAHTMYGGNTLLAHQVGAGKTFEMVASAMESKRLGLCTKSLFVVPNHLTEQMGAEFLRLYPAANILVATKKDFEAKNRKRLCSKIATGDYDAVIIGHSQLEKIPVSAERQERMIRRQINEITEGIESLGRSQGARFSVKQLEKTKRNLEAKLKKLTENPKRDDVVTFEELGIDKMFVDEAHSFKNLFLYTKMRNVAGIQQTEAQKSADLYMKCQYLDEITGGKGIVFATGTPVSNSMTELYTMMRYLQADKLKEMGMHNFDAWAANFGEAVTAIELAPEGTGYRAKTRFSKFFNLPELINVFKECADIKTADMLNLPVPEAHFHNVVVKPSDIQKDMVAALSDRAKDIHDKKVQPEEDNMLKVTNDGRKIGLDQRLIDPLLPDDPNSKVNTCVANVFDIYQKNDDKKSTQLVFCDFSTPKNDGSFNLYDDIRDKLIAKGVPKEEIAFIHEADSEAKKKELFSKVRQGKVRVLLGSTAKCGAGTNIQDKLIALHHLDCPWRPSDLEQREGRIIRQGNENKEVEVYRYMTEATFDAYLYVRHEVA